MSNLSYEQAVDEIQAMILAAWTPTGHKIFWEGVEADRETDDTAWAVSTIRHVTGRQQTLGGRGNRAFERAGIIIIQIFTRIGNGLHESYQLAKVMADGFEGKHSPGGVWFRNVTLNEVGKDGAFTQVNVNIEFRYNEIK